MTAGGNVMFARNYSQPYAKYANFPGGHHSNNVFDPNAFHSTSFMSESNHQSPNVSDSAPRHKRHCLQPEQDRAEKEIYGPTLKCVQSIFDTCEYTSSTGEANEIISKPSLPPTGDPFSLTQFVPSDMGTFRSSKTVSPTPQSHAPGSHPQHQTAIPQETFKSSQVHSEDPKPFSMLERDNRDVFKSNSSLSSSVVANDGLGSRADFSPTWTSTSGESWEVSEVGNEYTMQHYGDGCTFGSTESEPSSWAFQGIEGSSNRPWIPTIFTGNFSDVNPSPIDFSIRSDFSQALPFNTLRGQSDFNSVLMDINHGYFPPNSWVNSLQGTNRDPELRSQFDFGTGDETRSLQTAHSRSIEEDNIFNEGLSMAENWTPSAMLENPTTERLEVLSRISESAMIEQDLSGMVGELPDIQQFFDYDPPSTAPHPMYKATEQTDTPEEVSPSVSTESLVVRGPNISKDSSNRTVDIEYPSLGLILVEDTPELREYISRSKKNIKRYDISILDENSSETASDFNNTFVDEGFTDASKTRPKPSAQKRGLRRELGRRTGPLSLDKRKHARAMRKEGACLRCRLSRTTCGKGEICESCTKHLPMLPNLICCRAYFKDFSALFLPERIFRPYQSSFLTGQLQANQVATVDDSQFEINVSSGPNYPPISITVQVLRGNKEFFKFKKIMTDSNKDSRFVSFDTRPLGIPEQFSTQKIQHRLLEHIEAIVEGERNYGEVLYDNTSQLTWDVHEALSELYHANPQNKLYKSCMSLYAMQYFMTKSISLQPGFVESALSNQYGPLEFNMLSPNLSMVNDQIKVVMSTLIREAYVEVLDSLDKLLRPKQQKLWAESFFCIQTLCMCAEMVQTNMDLRVVRALRDSSGGEGAAANLREESIDVCRKLDDVAIKNAEIGFHLLYSKSKILKDGSIRDHSFNPIRNGVEVVRKENLGHNTEEFVDRLRTIANNHKHEFSDAASRLSFDGSRDLLEDHLVFRKHNSGRLVSRFLQSLL
ncbi:hypothetical protein HYFRA_00010480 [Hymenoscyphus fraxineus]|uniref:Zn(2)-C6 fungal-type domain-containing protein n=1 Tax=Hymenoscyphus fraxineus TaxID=746836 RepID=A0A9N9L3S3_9HELO|nr:hypothetical protein HYFRA_00010480 [Hymenoscyphus fraxineus]